MADKWTIRSNNEGLYNGVKPPEKKDRKIERKNKKEELLQYQEEHNLKKNFLSNNLPLGHYLTPPINPKLALRT